MATTLVKVFDVTIPAGTTKASPLVTPTMFADGVVERVEWLFPPGCRGLVGIQIGARSVTILPTDVSQWITRSGDSHGYDLTDMHTTGDWSVIGYNTGTFAHTVHVTFIEHRREPPSPPPIFPLESLTLANEGES